MLQNMALNVPKYTLPCLAAQQRLAEEASSLGTDYAYSHDNLGYISKNCCLTQLPVSYEMERRNAATECAKEDGDARVLTSAFHGNNGNKPRICSQCKNQRNLPMVPSSAAQAFTQPCVLCSFSLQLFPFCIRGFLPPVPPLLLSFVHPRRQVA